MRYLIFTISVILTLSIGLNAQSGKGIDSNAVDYLIPKSYEIGQIKVIGTENIREEVIIARSGLKVGDQIEMPGEQIAQAIRNIWKTGLFSDVKIYRDQKVYGNVAFIIIEVKEQPRLSQYFITGVSKSAIEDLKKKIDLKKGDPVTEYEKKRIEREINDHYVEKGFLFNTVEFFIKPDTLVDNAVILYVKVKRGEKVKINDIAFEGNMHVPDAKLRGVMKDTKMKTKVDLHWSDLKNIGEQSHSVLQALGNISLASLKDFLSEHVSIRIFNSSKFIEDKFEDDKRQIIQYYNSLGYRDAVIVSDSIYRVDEDDINILIKVNEGRQYYFRNITWSGNQKYPSEILSKILDIRKGEIYNQSLLQQRLFFDPSGQDISSIYMDDGYLFFNVVPREVKIVGDSIDIDIRIVEGPQAKVNKIIINGNDKTSERVIRRQLRTVPGKKFSRSDLIRSQREISALGYFDPEQLGINPIPHPEQGTVDIEYTVVEKPSDKIEFSAGWGGLTAGLYGSAGVVFNNFSLRKFFDWKHWKRGLPAGDGQQLSVRIQTRGRALQSYTFSFTEPWLGGVKPRSLSLSYNHTMLNYTPTLPRSDASSQYIITRGGTIGFGTRLKWPDDYFYSTTSLSIENYQLNNFSEFLVSNGNSNNVYIKQKISRLAAQGNPNFPEGGSNVEFYVQLTPPYSLLSDRINNGEEKYKWLEYHRWWFKADWFKTLLGQSDMGKRKLVLKAGAKFGFLGAYNKDRGISPFERFRVGGDGLSGTFILQGYDIISLRGTEQAFLPVGAVNSNDLNAPIFNKFNVELRYPVSLQQSSTIYVMLFAEAGNAYADWKYYNPFELKKAAGIGVRLFLPMFGLLGFDYGIPFDNIGQQSFGDFIGAGAFQFKLGFEPE